MKINQARTYNLPGTIDYLSTLRRFEPLAHGGNFAFRNKKVGNLVEVVGGINHLPALQEHATHRPTPYLLPD